MRQTKYARIERERRFLLAAVPEIPPEAPRKEISDRNIVDSNLRLRIMESDGGIVYKLTQKIPLRGEGYQQGLITTFYVTEAEYRLFSQLPANSLTKSRYSIPPFGIDVFHGKLEGLILAEVEYMEEVSQEEADALELPSWIVAEVTHDERFTGGRLSRTTMDEVRLWMRDYRL